MNAEILKNRIKKVRNELKNRGIDCLIVTKPANITYTTGFTGDDSWVVIALRKTYLLTDSRYSEQARNQCPVAKIVERADSLPLTTAKIITRSKSMRAVTVENCICLSDYNTLKKNISIRLKSTEGIIEQLRAIKDSAETAVIATATDLAFGALKRTLRQIKLHITENELAGRIDFEIRHLGAGNSFPTIVAFGSNASRPHHQPGSRRLKNNDTILVDWGVRYNSFYKKVYNIVLAAQKAVIITIRAGASIKEVDRAGRKILTDNRLPVYGHGTGHGLGLQVHEEPILSPKNKGRLQPGQIVTVEPAVYIPGKVGIRIEDDVLVTKTGCKVLSSAVGFKEPVQNIRLRR